MTRRRLVIDSKDQGQFFLLVEGGTVTIGGRDNPAETVLQNLRVCRIHCELEVEGEAIAVRRDSGSQELQPGVVLQTSASDLHLEADREDLAEDTPGLLSDQETALAPAMATAETMPSTSVKTVPKRFVVVDGADQGRSFILLEMGTMTIGKDRRYADITLNDLYLGRTHCQLKIDGDRITVIEEDSGRSAGGTFVNGKKVTHQELQLGDVLRVGNSHLRLEAILADEDEEEEAIAVEDEEAVEAEVLDDEEEEVAEVLPEDATEPVQQLRTAREQLAQLAGQGFGHYRLSRLLGRGRCGVVFHALDVKNVQNSQMVALKVLLPLFPQGEKELQRFVKVIKGILPLRHPNLVTVFTAGKTGEYMWIAREFVEGESVAEILRRLGPDKRLDWRRSFRVLIHTARALDYAHEHHFRHGKITPANLLIQSSDRAIRLTDLMLADALEGSQLLEAAQACQPLAELPYLAPEQTKPGAFVDAVSDLYSLGAVAYALLTARPPIQGNSAEEILEKIRSKDRVESPKVVNYTIPTQLEKVVMKLLKKQPEHRYQTPAELLADLEPIARDQEVEV